MLAQQYNLPATYDAHYLALAEHEKCEYWTADTRLWNAVRDKLPWVHQLSDYQSALH
jgi:predicted nucleic acid-binding protein